MIYLSFEDQMSVNALVTGKVIEVSDSSRNEDGSWNNPSFIIMTENSKKTFKATCDCFCRVMGGDIIEAKGYATPNENKELGFDFLIHLTETPIIEPGIDEASIKSVIARTFPRLGVMCMSDISRLYSKLSRLTSELDEYQGMSPPNRINLYMNRISAEYNRNSRESNLYEKFFPELDKDNAKKLLRNWYSLRVVRQLQMLGLTNDEIKDSKIQPDVLYDKIRLNPYTIPFISLERCITLCQRYSVQATDVQIKKGEILRSVYQNTKNRGWSGTPFFILRKKHPYLSEYLDDLVADTDLEGNTVGGYGLVRAKSGDTDLLMLRECFRCEMHVFKYIVKIVSERNADKRYMEPVYRMTTLSDDQKCAISGALNNAVSVITGGGGSGKTTSITEVILNLEYHKMNFLIVSFTGKAVVRVRQVLKQAQLSDSLIEPTFTIHRAIYKGIHRDEDDITHLIIDEASMCTTELISEFLSKFVNIRWICCVGDCNQLLPISWGSFFTEIISSGRIPVYYLTKNHRTYKVEGEEDGILTNCHAIANHPRDVPFTFKEFPNFKTTNGNERTIQYFITNFHRANVKDYQLTVVTPYNKVRESINTFFQSVYRTEYGPEGEFKDTKGRIWKKYDKVIMLENNYDIEVMNGEEGRVIDVNSTFLTVSFDPDAVFYKEEDISRGKFNRIHSFRLNIPLDDAYGGNCKKPQVDSAHAGMLSHGYALTGHKSQGSEYDFVIAYIPPDKKPSKSFLCRNLLYTILTRGKRAVYVIGNIPLIERIVTTRPSKRFECLSEWLVDGLEETKDGIDTRELLVGTFDPEDEDAIKYFKDDDDDDDW